MCFFCSFSTFLSYILGVSLAYSSKFLIHFDSLFLTASVCVCLLGLCGYPDEFLPFAFYLSHFCSVYIFFFALLFKIMSFVFLFSSSPSSLEVNNSVSVLLMFAF